MTGGRASLIWLVLLAAGVALFAGLWLLPHLSQVTEQTDTLSRLEDDSRQLAARVEELTRELSVTLAPTDEAPPGVDPQLARAEARARGAEAKRLEEIRLLAETQKKLDEATLALDDLNARFEKQASELHEAREQNRMLTESRADLKEQLSHANRVVNALQAELKRTSDRIVKLETRNRSLREENRESEKTIAHWKKALDELEGLHRRREDLLSNIVHRYRSVADEYRTVALRINNPEQYGPTQGVDLSRIQNALSLAGEDLNEVRSLNDRAARLERDLSN